MTCRALTISATNNRKVQASLRRASHRHPALVLALALVSGALLAVLSLTSHANQDPLVDVNRTVHGFNRAMDGAVLRSIGRYATQSTSTAAR